MSSIPLQEFSFHVSPDKIDADGYVSLWNIAADTGGGETAATRDLASRLLGFLCKHRCDFVVVSSTDAEYLDAWFERDNKLLYDWKPESETVDVLAQHAEVPYDAFQLFVGARGFKPDANDSPKRADRVSWFKDMWNVG